jgi:hypothetical protein
LPAHSGVESRGEANGLFANLTKSHVSSLSRLSLTAFEPSFHSQASLDLPIGISTDRAMEA